MAKETTQICQKCGKEYVRWNKYGRLCRECHAASLITVTCRKCGKNFTTFFKHVKECPECIDRHPKVTLVCASCGKEFQCRWKNTRRFCDECRRGASRGFKREIQYAEGKKIRLSLPEEKAIVMHIMGRPINEIVKSTGLSRQVVTKLLNREEVKDFAHYKAAQESDKLGLYIYKLLFKGLDKIGRQVEGDEKIKNPVQWIALALNVYLRGIKSQQPTDAGLQGIDFEQLLKVPASTEENG